MSLTTVVKSTLKTFWSMNFGAQGLAYLFNYGGHDETGMMNVGEETTS